MEEQTNLSRGMAIISRSSVQLQQYSFHIPSIPPSLQKYLLSIPHSFHQYSFHHVGHGGALIRVDTCRPQGCGFESRSSRHVGTLGKSFTCSVCSASRINSDTVS